MEQSVQPDLVRDPNEMLVRHILDSIVVARICKVNGLSMSAPDQDCQAFTLYRAS